MWSAIKQNEKDHEEFRRMIAAHYHPEQLVFTEESYFNWLTLQRPYAWAKCGEHASHHKLQYWGSNSILHLEVIENGVTSAAFCWFVGGFFHA